MLKNKKYIIWDWNGTLLNDAEHAYNVLIKMQKKRNIPRITFAEYQMYYVHPIRNLYLSSGFDLDNESFDELRDEWAKLYIAGLKEVDLHSDTREILSRIKQIGK